MKIKLFGAIILLFVAVCQLSAQTKTKTKTDAHITGHITDSKTKEHIPFVTVLLKGTTIGAISDATGHFLIKNVPAGKHIITASFVGYKTVEQEINVELDKTLEVKLELAEQILKVDDIVVTGTRNETKKSETATIVNVISNKLFEVTSSNNIAEVLNYQSGLRVEYNCSNCGVPQLRINGLEGQYSQILLDSRPIFSSLATVYGLEQLPAGMVERVEVIRGGGSALFGSNAIGGVVNIITKEPLRNLVTLSNNLTVLEDGGIDNNTTLNAAFVTDDHKAGVYIFGMVKNRDSYDRDKDGFSEIPKVNSETIGFRGYYKMSSSSRITAEYHHIKEFRRGGNLMERPPHEADIAEQLRHNIDGGGLKYDLFSKNLKDRLSIYTSVQNIDRESYFGTNKNLDAYGSTKDLTFIAGGQFAHNFDKLILLPSVLTVGAEYSNNELNDEMLGYNRKVEQTSICYGAYLQNEWKNEKISFLIGGRLDKHNKVKNAIFSPRVNLRYTPIKNIGLRASYSSGYRAPQAYEEDLHVAAVGGEVSIISIDPNLRPEYSKSFSASADLYHSFGSVETNLLVEGFYTDLKDVFTLHENGRDAQNNLLLERRNASGAVVKGVNFELKVGFSPKLILDGGFTIQSSRYKEDHKWSNNEDIKPQRTMFRSPNNYGYLTLNYTPTKRLTFSATGNYTGNMLVQHFGDEEQYGRKDSEKTTPQFVDLGTKLSYDFTLSSQVKLQVNVGVKNILDKFQRDIDKGVTRDAGYIYGPASPRNYFVGIKLSL